MPSELVSYSKIGKITKKELNFSYKTINLGMSIATQEIMNCYQTFIDLKGKDKLQVNKEGKTVQ